MVRVKERSSGEWARIQLRFLVCVCFVATPSCKNKREHGGEREKIRPEQTTLSTTLSRAFDREIKPWFLASVSTRIVFDPLSARRVVVKERLD